MTEDRRDRRDGGGRDPSRPSVSATLMSLAGQGPSIMPDFAAVRRSLSQVGVRPAVLARQDDAARSALDAEVADARRRLASNPGSAVAHLGLATALRHRGDTAEAIAIYRRCAEADVPEIAVSARYFLAALGAVEQPASAPELYVTALFDEYADDFEQVLVDRLHYKGPRDLHRAVRAVMGDGARDLDIMDAGCGTGLCGQIFRPMARRLDGVDVSQRMLDNARRKNIYDDLTRGELCDVIRTRPNAYDVVLAGDVLNYLGEPAPVLEAVAVALHPAGLFAFTTERAASGCRLAGNGRYQHADAHVEAAARDAGFRVVRRDDIVVRLENGEAVSGAAFVMARG